MTKIACSVSDPHRSRSAQRHWSQLGLHSYLRIAVVGGLLCLLFRNEIERIIHLWISDPSWSHGFLIPLFSLYFIHQRREAILNLEFAPDRLANLMTGRPNEPLGPGQTRANYLGLVFLLGMLAFYAFNVVSPAGYAYFRPLALIGTLAAVVLFLGGWRLLTLTWLPIVFLIFAVPLPRRYYVSFTIPMRELAATVATALLNMVSDLQASCSGVVIDIVYQGRRLQPPLDVAEACSGMRLLMAFLALGVAMAYLHERPFWQRLVLLVSTVPIAILCNIIRVTITGFLYVLVDPIYTQGTYHDALGLAMLPLAFGLYGFLAWFMSSLFVTDGHHDGANVIVRRQTVR